MEQKESWFSNVARFPIKDIHAVDLLFFKEYRLGFHGCLKGGEGQ